MPRRIPIYEYQHKPPRPERRVIRSFDELPAIMDTASVALALDVSIETVKKLIGGGKLDAFKVGTHWRICKDDLVGYIKRNKATA